MAQRLPQSGQRWGGNSGTALPPRRRIVADAEHPREHLRLYFRLGYMAVQGHLVGGIMDHASGRFVEQAHLALGQHDHTRRNQPRFNSASGLFL